MPAITNDSPQAVKDKIAELYRLEIINKNEHLALFYKRVVNTFFGAVYVKDEELRQAVMLEF